MFIEPHVSSKPLMRAYVEERLISEFLTTLAQAIFGVHNEVNPKVFHFRLMSLYLIEYPVITFSPNNPMCDALEEIPNLRIMGDIMPTWMKM